MSRKKHGIWLGYIILSLYFIWLISSMSPMGRATADAFSRYIPGWLAMSSWAICPLLAALLMGPLDIPAYLWVPLYAVLLISLTFFAVSFHSHPYISLLILVISYFEIYWLLPKWRGDRNESQ